GKEHGPRRQGHDRKSREKCPPEGFSEQGDPRHFAGHDDLDAALQGCKGRWLVRGRRGEERLAGLLGMRPHGPKGPVGPYSQDACIARRRSTATSTRRGTS